MRDYEVNSDLRSKAIQKKLKFKQFDNGSTIKVNLYEDGEKVAIETDWTIVAKFKRADGEKYNREVSDISDNTFLVTLDSTVTAVIGDLLVDFKITYGDKQVTTFSVLLEIEESIGEGNSGEIGGNTEGSIDINLNNYYKKSETYSKEEIDSQFNTIANKIKELKLVAGEDNSVKLMLGDIILSSITINGGTVEQTEQIVGTVSSDNTITLTGLDIGTYTLKYEDDNGVLEGYDTIAEMEVI